MTFRRRRFPKRGGGHRIVVAPSKQQKHALRKDLPVLHAIAKLLDVHGVQHGFVPGRSPVTCAKQHVGYQWTGSWDLEDCFDHVTAQGYIEAAGRVPRMDFFDVSEGDVGCRDNWIARAGLPTSPAICNIVLAPMDAAIVGRLNGRGVYTRYADDLVISTNSRDVLAEMHLYLPAIAGAYGQRVKDSKTRLQCAAAGRRIVVGIAVGLDGIYPTRKVKRRLRAAIHQRRHKQAHGLGEWYALRDPKVIRKALEVLADGPLQSSWVVHTMLASQIAAEDNNT